MRTIARLLGMVVGGLALMSIPLAPSSANEGPAEGKYKVVGTLGITSVDLLIVDLKPEGDGLKASLVKGAQYFGGITVEKAEKTADGLKLTLKIGDQETIFVAKGNEKDGYRGSVKLQGATAPTVMTKTDSNELAQPQPSTIMTKMRAAMQEAGRSEEKLVEGLRPLLKDKELAGKPDLAMVYRLILQYSDKAKMKTEEVKQLADEWIKSASTYGEDYTRDIRMMAAEALSNKPDLAQVSLALVKEVDQALAKEAGAAAETREQVLELLANAAKLAKDEDLVKSTEGRLKAITKEVDEEYHKTVPPFKAEAFAGREDKESDRVVLLELFTGAQCPPCVAADVAFDALNKSYKPSELITLQYHLHIPGPDPLTNADSVARAKYYPDLRGTPSTFFNGTTAAGGGGGMANSKSKYSQYVESIKTSMAGKKQGSIVLKPTRKGDEIKVAVDAKVSDADGKSETLKLRMALVEESIRYVGGNRLRFHHHVVRAMPGGAEGKELVGGKLATETTINLADVRKGLESYLSDYEKTRAFPKALPPIDLKNLKLVAFIQNDSDKSVLDVVQVDIPNETP